MHVTALMRGFDRGNDESELAAMERFVAEASDIRDGDLRYHAALLIRAHRFDDAWRSLELSIARNDGAEEASYLLGHLLLHAGDRDGAMIAMERAVELTADNRAAVPFVDHAHALHGRALVRLALGDEAGARSDLEHARKKDSSSWIAIELAKLLAKEGDDARAIELTRAALRDESWNSTAQVLLLELGMKRGGADAAMSLFGDTLASQETVDAVRSRDDLTPLRAHPTFARLLEEPPPPDCAWLDTLPAWFQALRADPRLQEASVAWLGARERDEETSQLREQFNGGFYPMGSLWSDALFEASREAVTHATVVGVGPSIHERSLIDRQVFFVIDDRRPDQLVMALTREGPAALWIPCGSSADSVLAKLSEIWPTRSDTRATFPKTVRLFGGYLASLAVPSPYSGGLEQAGPHELARHWTMSPWMLHEHWGSRQLDDPWPARIPPQPAFAVKTVAFQREVQLQEDGGVCSWTRRTTFSRSYVTFELHRCELYVIEVRYQPSTNGAAIEALNQRFGATFPTDLPLDVVGALIGFGHQTVEPLRDAMATAPSVAPYLVVLAALLCHDLVALRALLREHLRSSDPAVVATCANLAITYNLEFILEEMLLAGVEDALVPQIRSILETGIVPEAFDENGEPVQLYGGGTTEENEV